MQTTTGKFKPGTLVLVTGMTKSGKTTFMKRLLNQAIDAGRTAVWWSKPYLPTPFEIRPGAVVFMTDVQHLLTPGSGYLGILKHLAVTVGCCIIVKVTTMREARIHDSVVVSMPTPMLTIPDVIVHTCLTIRPDFVGASIVSVPMVMKNRYGPENLPFDLLW